MPGIDWFDHEWDAVAHNAKVLARVAKRGGCVGLMFDPEQYGNQRIWTYSALPEAVKTRIPKEKYVAKVMERGMQFMRAINSEFPDVKILCLFGPALALDGRGERYDLLAPFLEGMCRVATPGTEIIDGYEQSYPYRTEPAFREAREKMKVRSRRLFRDKSAFDRVMRVGFGLWLDYNSGRIGWHPDEPEKNHFQPETFQTAVHYALSYSDGYVWIYSQQLNWWTGRNVSEAYELAMRKARKAPGKIAPPKRVRKPKGRYIPRAKEQRGYDDESTFGDLLKTHEILFDFPAKGWLFRPDPEDRGIKEKWYRVDLDEADWSPIEIKKFWEEQGWDYDGVAWYRTRFVVPQIPKGRKIFLVVGAADESATVWLNGERIGVHDIGEAGWTKRFS
ncbi:MAG TPA: hypothetical protein EYP10_11900, partial [Armatimonadetes bacterium]|nr:hypothetical protein [Armatimonadota bacterium]